MKEATLLVHQGVMYIVTPKSSGRLTKIQNRSNIMSKRKFKLPSRCSHDLGYLFRLWCRPSMRIDRTTMEYLGIPVVVQQSVVGVIFLEETQISIQIVQFERWTWNTYTVGTKRGSDESRGWRRSSGAMG